MFTLSYQTFILYFGCVIIVTFYFYKQLKLINSCNSALILTQSNCFIHLALTHYGCLSVHLPFHCSIRQLVCHSNFLIRKFLSSKDYSASDRRTFDMGVAKNFYSFLGRSSNILVPFLSILQALKSDLPHLRSCIL